MTMLYEFMQRFMWMPLDRKVMVIVAFIVIAFIIYKGFTVVRIGFGIMGIGISQFKYAMQQRRRLKKLQNR